MAASRLERAPQMGLFDGLVTGGGSSGPRHALDAYSWVEHIPGWLAEPEALFDLLAVHASWEQRSRWMFTRMVVEPRLTAELHALAAVPEIRVIAERLSRHYGVVYDSTWMNLYRDHEDSTGWHADRPANQLPTAIVPVLSLGATRRFLVRPSAGGKSITFHVAAGDLVVMGGRCQRDWVHMVPKESQRTGARISVNFGSSEQSSSLAR